MGGSANSAALTFLSASVFSMFALLITYLPPQIDPFKIAAKRALTIALVLFGSLLGVVVLLDHHYDFAAKLTVVMAMVVGLFVIVREYRVEIVEVKIRRSTLQNKMLLGSYGSFKTYGSGPIVVATDKVDATLDRGEIDES